MRLITFTALHLSVFLFAVCIIPSLSYAEIAFKCAAGGMSHTASQQEADSAPEAGIIAGVTQVCGSDAALGINNAAGAAKKYLNSLPNKCVGSCQALPDKAHIDKLDNTFAICAAGFFEAYQATYGPVSISSAFRCGPRTPAVIQCDRTENRRASGASDSNHMLGLAIDVNPLRSSYQSMWDFARVNPKFGVCFPYLGGDNPHMTLAGSGTGEAAACAKQGVTKPCNGLPFTPITPAPGSGTYSRAPSSGISSILRSMFAPTPPPLSQYQQYLPPTQQPFQYSQPQTGQIMTYNPSTGTYTSGTVNGGGTQATGTQMGGGTTAGVSNGTSANNSPVNILNALARSSTNNSINTSEQASFLYASQNNTNGSTTRNDLSALEMIEQLAGYPTSTEGVMQTTSTSGPAALNQNVQNVTNNTQRNQNAVATRTVATMSTSVPAYMPAQTFTSDDLRNSNTYSTYSPQQLSTFQKILAQLRNVLILILKYLQPFGGTVVR